MSPADFSALMGGNNRGNYGGWGDFGGQGWWILLLFLFAGGWNNNGWGNRGGGLPYVMNQDTQADIQRGFDQQATQSTLANIQSQIGNGFADAAVANCQGNANVTAAITNGQYETAQAVTNGQYATAQAITGAKDCYESAELLLPNAVGYRITPLYNSAGELRRQTGYQYRCP